MNQYQVGDRVKGRISGRTGTITEIVGDDRYAGTMDDGEPGWTFVKGDMLEPAPEPVKVEKAAPKFKVGDLVAHNVDRPVKQYDVMAVSEDGIHLWLRNDDGPPPFTGIAAVYKKVPPFFEAGKKYTIQQEWSITFQAANMHEVFEVARVDIDSKGTKTAYGRLFLPGVEQKYGDRWVTKHQFDFDTEQWRKTT